MTRAFVIVGTDTNVGKTVVFRRARRRARRLLLEARAVGPRGRDGFADRRASFGRRAGAHSPGSLAPASCPPRRISPRAPTASRSTPKRLIPPTVDGPLVIETAGGVMMPLTDHVLTIDLLARWRLPVVLVRAHLARHDQSQPAHARSPAPSRHSHSWRRLHRRGAKGGAARRSRASAAYARSAVCRDSIRSRSETLRDAFAAAFSAERLQHEPRHRLAGLAPLHATCAAARRSSRSRSAEGAWLDGGRRRRAFSTPSRPGG